jgi:hypothetical protein
MRRKRAGRHWGGGAARGALRGVVAGTAAGSVEAGYLLTTARTGRDARTNVLTPQFHLISMR